MHSNAISITLNASNLCFKFIQMLNNEMRKVEKKRDIELVAIARSTTVLRIDSLTFLLASVLEWRVDFLLLIA